MRPLKPWRLALPVLLAALVAVAGSAGAQLRPVPDDDPDLASGWAAYQVRDLTAALAYFRTAAERDQRVAQFNLAVMLISGEGVAADPELGLVWLRRAAGNGMARA